jgi:dephospho-CoA kinase
LYDDMQARQKAILDLPHIAVVGKMGAGKTTAADILVRKYGYNRASFAGILKEVAHLIWGDGAERDRRKLQELGVAVRDIQEDSWVNALLRRIQDWRGPVVIDDCRFPNEYWALKHMGFKFIRIRADEAIREDRLMRNGKLQSRAQLEHISETALDGIDADLGLMNESDEYALESNLTDIVERLRKQVI